MTPETFRALTGSLEHPALLISEHGVVREANPHARRLFGATPGSCGSTIDLSSWFEGPDLAWRDSIRGWAGSGWPSSRPIRLRGANGRSTRYRAEGVRVMGTGPEPETLVLLHLIADNPTPARPGPSDDRPPGRETNRNGSPRAEARNVGKMEALGGLAGSIAHDFNNFLTVVRGEVELSLEHPDLPEVVQESLEAALGAVSRAEAVVSGLLAFSRHQVSLSTPSDLGTILRGIEPELRALSGGGAIEVTYGPDPLPVRVDPEQVRSITLSLVRNALEALRPGGRVRVRSRRAVLGPGFVRDNPGSRRGTFCAVEVEDDGHGIRPEVSARMFEPFFTTKGPGRGLGLARSYGIVKSLGGYLGVETEIGVGSRFTVYLPIEDPDRPSVSPSIR